MQWHFIFTYLPRNNYFFIFFPCLASLYHGNCRTSIATSKRNCIKSRFRAKISRTKSLTFAGIAMQYTGIENYLKMLDGDNWIKHTELEREEIQSTKTKLFLLLFNSFLISHLYNFICIPDD